VDLILTNANIITMDPKKPMAEAVAIKDGKFVKVGSEKDVLALKESNTEILNLKGKLLLPGFNDSHMHLLSFGSLLRKANLSGIKSIEELIENAKAFINDKGITEDKWVLGGGWHHDLFKEKRFPTRYDLDRISTKHPICLTRACYHVAVVNTRALEILGINKDTSQVEGGHFEVDEAGEPLGIFSENAVRLIYDRMTEPSLTEIKDLLHEASVMASKDGITSVQTDDFGYLSSFDFEKVISAYRELIAEEKLFVRVNEQCLLPDKNKMNKFLDKGYRTGYGDNYFKIGPVKLLTDGSLGARTAYLGRPYNDDPSTCGISVYSQEELDELVNLAHSNGMQIALHCIGSGAMYMTFSAIEKAQSIHRRDNHRHSIIHCQITDETILNKFRDLGVVAHIQPIFIDYDLHIVEDRVGNTLAETSYNWKTMLNKGVHVACGSDCPIESFNVLRGIYCAVTRKDLQGNPKGGWLPSQKLTVEEAVHGFTMGAAFASFEEDLKGSISPGKLADMAVLSSDIFNIPEDEIKDAKVLLTILGGKIVYKDKSEFDI
jgi:predicted amidohydrolase YtcJ